MSFPHRTAFYDREEEEIYEPANGFYVLDSTGDVVTPDRQGDFRGVEHLIPLASTELVDNLGNEIFEGHICEVQSVIGLTEGITIYHSDSACFRWFCGQVAGTVDLRNFPKMKPEIVGHALTDPDLVPNSFDVEGYFELHD